MKAGASVTMEISSHNGQINGGRGSNKRGS